MGSIEQLLPRMITQTVEKIEARLRSNEIISPDKRRELLELLATLKGEIATLARTHGDHAQSIASFTEVSAHEAMRATQDPRLLKLSLEGLSSSVKGFEVSHPKLVQLVNHISQTLSNLGI